MTDSPNLGGNFNQPPYPSGCEIFSEPDRRSSFSSSTLQKLSHSFEHASQYFSISYLDGRLGYGAIATCDIPKHTLILEEPPLLPCDFLQEVMEKHERGDLKCHDDDDHLLKDYFSIDHNDEDVNRLRAMVWSMHDQYAEDYDEGSDRSLFAKDSTRIDNASSRKRLWGIIYSNAFYNSESTINNSNLTNEKIFRPTLHFLAAKLNHSCSPNVGYDFSSNLQRMFTTRDVKKGEELFDCYSDVVYHEPAWVRRAFLKEKYNFDCQCSACSPSFVAFQNNDIHEEFLVESDNRRKSLKEIAITLSNRIGASFLYNENFDEEIQNTVSKIRSSEYSDSDEIPTDSEDDDSWNVDINGVATNLSFSKNSRNGGNKGKFKPTSDDLYNLLDYIHLLRQEGIDHDAVECIELAFDLAVHLNDRHVLKTYNLGNECLNLYEVSKGTNHKSTKSFRKKLRKTPPSLCN